MGLGPKGDGGVFSCNLGHHLFVLGIKCREPYEQPVAFFVDQQLV